MSIEQREPQAERVFWWGAPGEPLDHLIYYTFDEGRPVTRELETARDLVEIFDALTGANVVTQLEVAARDRRQRLRGIEDELRRVLYGALEAGVLKFERHEVPWPFPEKEEKPEDRGPQKPVDEKPANFMVRVVDILGGAMDGIGLVFEVSGQRRNITADGSGRARWSDAQASQATVSLADIQAARKKLTDRLNASKGEERWKPPADAEVTSRELDDGMAPITVQDAIEHTLVLEPPPLDLPPQLSDARFDDEEETDLRIASNDPSFIPGGLWEKHKQRGKDTGSIDLPGTYIPFRKVDSVVPPTVTFDHGFLDDGNHNLDLSKKQSPTAADYRSLAKWELMLAGAMHVRPDLADGTRGYWNFLHGNGRDLEINYDNYVTPVRTRHFVAVDGAGITTLESAIDDTRAGAAQLHDESGLNSFLMQTGGISCGEVDDQGEYVNPRYPYPFTENWQKAIGAHVIWLEADVTVLVDTAAATRSFVIQLTLHAEDRYNFNPGAKDIKTNVLDAENGRFEVTGLGHEFFQYGSLKRAISFTLPVAPAPDYHTKPSDETVVKPPPRL